MSSLADRLRGVIAPGPPKSGPHMVPGPPGGGPYIDDERGACFQAAHDSAADILGGDWVESRGQRFLVIDRKYSPGHRHGHMAVADSLPPSDGIWPRLPLLAGPT